MEPIEERPEPIAGAEELISTKALLEKRIADLAEGLRTFATSS